MLIPLNRLGAIEDLGLGLRWDPAGLRAEIDRRAAALARIGLGEGSVVAIAHGGTARFFADLLATWHLGGTAACLDPALTGFEREHVLGFLKPAAILIDDAPIEGTSSIPQLALAQAAKPADAASLPPPSPEAAALLLFTSGTTGSPKGVVLSFRALAARLSRFHHAGQRMLAVIRCSH